MSYVDAPATALVATDCAACGRPLLDAKSVEKGMGPHCRKKYGYGKPDAPTDWGMALMFAASVYNDCPTVAKAFEAEDAHAAANAIVHQIALWQVSERTPMLVTALHCLGYHKLAEACARGTSIKVETEGSTLVVLAPFNEVFNLACRSVPGARWDRDRNARTVPAASKGQLWRAIKASYPKGTMVFGARAAVV